MDRVKIKILYALEDALAAGEPSHGEGVYLPTAAELGALDARERAALVRWTEGAPGARPLRVTCARPSWADVRAAVAREVELAEQEAMLYIDVVEWAATAPGVPPELARAAREGYAVGNAVLDLVAERLAASLGFSTEVVLVEGSPRYERSEWEERAAPDATAFRWLDAVQCAVGKLDLPPGVTVDVEKIARFRRHADDPFTAVIARVRGPGPLKERLVVFDAEREGSEGAADDALLDRLAGARGA